MEICENYYERIISACDAIGVNVTSQCLYVLVGIQRMYFYNEAQLEMIYVVSTAAKGISQIQDSEGTPLGLHEVADKIGEGVPLGTVFIGRENTGKTFTEYSDWKTKNYVTSRILRLRGLEEGYNSGGNCDTYNRYIYIHGTTSEKVGIPWTSGCIGMCNDDIVELFPKIAPGSLVLIQKR